MSESHDFLTALIGYYQFPTSKEEALELERIPHTYCPFVHH